MIIITFILIYVIIIHFYKIILTYNSDSGSRSEEFLSLKDLSDARSLTTHLSTSIARCLDDTRRAVQALAIEEECLRKFKAMSNSTVQLLMRVIQQNDGTTDYTIDNVCVRAHA